MLTRRIEMKGAIRGRTAAVTVAAALTMASAAAVAGYSIEQDLGSPGQNGFLARVIKIGAETRWANVQNNELIRFVDVSTGQSFVWRFDTLAMLVDLARVAPSGFAGGRRVEVYVTTPGPS
jgi:hypothetical protein